MSRKKKNKAPNADAIGPQSSGPEGEEKAKLVGRVFDHVADRYDLMNDLMSGGIHRLWKDSFVDQLTPRLGERILDVAGGTGDVAFRVLERLKMSGPKRNPSKTQVIVCDINPSMLSVGRDRAIDRGLMAQLSWVTGDAEQLPLPDKCVDAYTIAFGIRNVSHLEKAIEEAYRVLAPGGTFQCLEFSKMGDRFLERLYRLYADNVIPMIGEWITGSRSSYEYLVESIRRFPDQETLAGIITNAGFGRVAYRNLSGGVVAIHNGRRL
jgi:demethylmenaquinone methyltransferase/2-methoxy-6-polyprenyl-1,4-benzoquinol methylase